MNVEERAVLSSFRQYATVYNELTETCFSNCVHDLGQRRLKEEESTCADLCAAKLIQATNRMVWRIAEQNPLEGRMGQPPPTAR